MTIIDHIPAILKISGIFVIILFAIRKNISLGNAFTGGAVLLGLIFGLTPLDIVKSVFFSIIHPKTLTLSIVVGLILILSHSMETAGQMSRLLDRFKGLFSHMGISLFIFPALIGLLPMPGGAIFSAPMVKNLGDQGKLSPAKLSYINYWFRHIWEYWWPLYPGVLLATTIAGLDLWHFVLFMSPLTFIAILSGTWPLRGIKHDNVKNDTSQDATNLIHIFKELLPILVVIFIGLGLGALFSLLFENFAIAKETGLIIALLLSIWLVFHTNGFSYAQRWSIIKQRQMIQMLYMITGILIFKGILEDSHAVQAVSQDFISWNIPLLPITIILPFIVGGIAGITIAFVGTTFPILISLIQTFGQTDYLLAYMMLAMVSGFVGVLASPLHLCLLLSNKYFGTSLLPVYRHLWFPCVVLLITGCVYFILLYHLL